MYIIDVQWSLIKNNFSRGKRSYKTGSLQRNIVILDISEIVLIKQVPLYVKDQSIIQVGIGYSNMHRKSDQRYI